MLLSFIIKYGYKLFATRKQGTRNYSDPNITFIRNNFKVKVKVNMTTDIIINYPLGSMRIGGKSWTNWNKAPLKLWQTQLNFAVWCASKACGVSSKHLNYKKHPMVRAVYRFHVYYHLRRILPHQAGFNAADNPYTNEEFFKICEDYGVPHDL